MAGRNAFTIRGLGALLVSAGLLAGCEEPDLTLPTAQAVEETYSYGGSLQVAMSGNVAEITIVQPEQQLRRGGTLWAKVGPYILLFTSETESLFLEYPGLAGVRVVTTTPSGTEVARALLPRSSLNDLTWRRALNVAGLARRDGTRRPTRLEDLVRWGEDHTEYTYNPRYSRP
ncbi:hypothetical protein ACFL5A_04320 [Gemmatimonadota bacterium]